MNVSGDPRDGTNGRGFYIADAMEYGGDFNAGNWSRVDLRTSYYLGNGLVGFVHVAANLDPAGFPSGTREMLLRVRAGFGSVAVGRQSTAYATAGRDPFYATFMQARGNGGMLGGTGGLGNGGYLDNAIGYSGRFTRAAVAGTLAIDSADVPGDRRTSGEHAYALRVNLDLSAAEVWVAYTNADEYRERGIGDDFRATKLGAEHRTGPFGLMAQYENVRFKDRLTGVDDERAGDYMMATGTYRRGANTFMAGYGQFSAENDLEQRWIALGMRHAFNRQVSVHGGVRQTGYNDGDDRETALGAGMRVVF